MARTFKWTSEEHGSGLRAGLYGMSLRVVPSSGVGEPVWWRVSVQFAYRGCQFVVNPTTKNIMTEEDAKKRAETIAQMLLFEGISHLSLQCLLSDCRSWHEERQGCGGTGWWPMMGRGCEPAIGEPMSAKHRCMHYQPHGMEEAWLWPLKADESSGGIVGAGRMPEGTKGRELWLEHEPTWPEGY